MIIQFIIFVIFLVLLTQAILETILGLCMIAQGLFWQLIGAILSGMARLLDAYLWVRKAFTTQ